MSKLAIIPDDRLQAYADAGYAAGLENFYNPLHYFKEVYFLSPFEKEERYVFGMRIIPTLPRFLRGRLRQLDVQVVRAYGGYGACDMACNNKVPGIPVVVSVHDTNPQLLYKSISKADVVFCVSEAVRRLILTRFKRQEHAWILPNRVDLDVMRPLPYQDFSDLDNRYPFKFKILHVGRKTRQKNLDTLIKALKILGDDYCLVAIGRGQTQAYLRLAEELGVQGRCYFLECVANEKLPLYYSWADCMCVPSRWEGFGIVFIEALACESVVVTSDIAPMNEFISHGENGLLVGDYEATASLAEAIKAACNDSRLRCGIKRNARASVRKFDRRIVDRLEATYYKKVIAMGKNGDFGANFWQRVLMRQQRKQGRVNEGTIS